MKIQIWKVAKTAAGASASIALAMALGLQNPTSAGIITLLSIQNTKKETLLVAAKRFGAFVFAMAAAWVSFTLLGYNVWAFGLYLLLFVGFCHHLRLYDAIAVCSVLVTHFWIAQTLRPAFFLNELLLLVIGAGTGIALNLFLSRNVREIQRVQRQVEERFKEALTAMGEFILEPQDAGTVSGSIARLKEALSMASRKAQELSDNTLLSDMQYYVRYVQLRKAQYGCLKRVSFNLERIRGVPRQAHVLARFVRLISESFHEYNNASSLLEEGALVKKIFRESDLPKTREEFEARAVLYQIFNDIDDFIQLKRDFAEGLSVEERRIFWGEGGRAN